MPTKKKWSQKVTETSDAMDVEGGTFTQTDPKKLAEAVERDAERSTRRKSSPYRSAMSMLTFYINRAGSNLTAKQRKVLDEAKEVLRAEFGPTAKPKPSRKSTKAKSVRKVTKAKK
ncbi:MAG: DUF3175 domain-containing protein [Candidatus Velthaea sp.]